MSVAIALVFLFPGISSLGSSHTVSLNLEFYMHYCFPFHMSLVCFSSWDISYVSRAFVHRRGTGAWGIKAGWPRPLPSWLRKLKPSEG